MLASIENSNQTPMLSKLRQFATVSTLNLTKSAVQISQKTLSTQLLLTRLVLEQSQNPSESRLVQASSQLKKTVDRYKSFFSLPEIDLLAKPVGSWSRDEKFKLDSYWEQFGILLYALRIFKEIPAYDTKFPSEQMYKSTAIIPAMPETITTFLEYFQNGEGASPDHMVSAEELKRAVNTAEAWFWRSRAQVILDLKLNLKDQDAKDKLPMGLKQVMKNIEEAVRLGTERALADGLVQNQVNGDFGVFNGVQAYKDLGDHEIRDLNRIAEARLNTLGWLMGTHEWDYEPGELKFINPMGSLWSPE